MPNRDPEPAPAKLIIFGGLPGVGKSRIARELAAQIGAVYLRIDSIEQALRDSGAVVEPMNDAGYRAAHAIAKDNLRDGRTVVADCVNPLSITRNAWRQIADRTGVRALEVEVRCSNVEEHRRRVENRMPDIPGLVPLTWNQVLAREYEPWDRDHIELDTARQSPEETVRLIRHLVDEGG